MRKITKKISLKIKFKNTIIESQYFDVIHSFGYINNGFTYEHYLYGFQIYNGIINSDVNNGIYKITGTEKILEPKPFIGLITRMNKNYGNFRFMVYISKNCFEDIILEFKSNSADYINEIIKIFTPFDKKFHEGKIIFD